MIFNFSRPKSLPIVQASVRWHWIIVRPAACRLNSQSVLPHILGSPNDRFSKAPHPAIATTCLESVCNGRGAVPTEGFPFGCSVDSLPTSGYRRLVEVIYMDNSVIA